MDTHVLHAVVTAKVKKAFFFNRIGIFFSFSGYSMLIRRLGVLKSKPNLKILHGSLPLNLQSCCNGILMLIIIYNNHNFQPFLCTLIGFLPADETLPFGLYTFSVITRVLVCVRACGHTRACGNLGAKEVQSLVNLCVRTGIFRAGHTCAIAPEIFQIFF